MQIFIIVTLISVPSPPFIKHCTLQVEKNSISFPAEGLIIYQTDADAGFYFYDGTGWKNQGGVTSINGINPLNNGELSLDVPTTQIGTQADRIATNTPSDGLIHIVASLLDLDVEINQ